MMLGACAVGVHMAMTHAICLSMLSAYIPATELPGLGRVSGTVWSFTDFVLGNTLPALAYIQCKLHSIPRGAVYLKAGILST